MIQLTMHKEEAQAALVAIRGWLKVHGKDGDPEAIDPKLHDTVAYAFLAESYLEGAIRRTENAPSVLDALNDLGEALRSLKKASGGQ